MSESIPQFSLPVPYNPKKIYQGDRWVPEHHLKLADMSPWDGPQDLNGCEVNARLRKKVQGVETYFDVSTEIIDPDELTVKQYMPSEDTQDLPLGVYDWDLQVTRTSDGQNWTQFYGKTECVRDVVEP